MFSLSEVSIETHCKVNKGIDDYFFDDAQSDGARRDLKWKDTTLATGPNVFALVGRLPDASALRSAASDVVLRNASLCVDLAIVG